MKKQKLKVLLIEIRNSEDTDLRTQRATPKAFDPLDLESERRKNSNVPDKEAASGVLDQLGKPLKAFWSAGHGSVTGRDRNGLDLLIKSHDQDLELHQIVFDDQAIRNNHFGIDAAEDPLSWSLTPRERKDLEKYSQTNMTVCLNDAKTQFLKWDSDHLAVFRCERSRTEQK